MLTTLLTAVSVSMAGLVGFIGLVSPHLSRRLSYSSNHSVLMILSSLLGAALLTFADSLGRIIATDFAIPAGSVSALFGAPILIFLRMREKTARAE